MERRLNATEVRSVTAGKELRVSGYAATYGTLSGDLGGFKERIGRRAFDRVLSTKPDVVCLLNHNVNNILGRTSAGTLTLRSDDKGLAFECLLPNTQAGRDTHESVKRGDLAGCSFAFNCGAGMDEWSEEDDEEDGIRSRGKRIAVRTLRDFARLMDVSVCASPAYSQTTVAARSAFVAAEVRSRGHEIAARIKLTQERIDHLVDTRDLTLYPLSGYEKRILANRKAAIDFILS